MDIVKRFTHNASGKDYIVGDLHGCYDDLMIFLSKINFDTSVDRLFSVGDLIDRGPKSVECANLIFEKWFQAVRGNHEQMMINALEDKQYNAGMLWITNGGMWYAAEEPVLMNDLAATLNQLPYIIVIGEGDNRINIVHAEILNATDDDIDNATWSNEAGIDNAIWGRSLISYSDHYLTPQQLEKMQTGLSLTVCGHTPVTEPRRICNQLFIDGGGVYHHLTDGKTSHAHRLMIYDIANKQVLQYIMCSGEILTTPLQEVKRS